MKFSKTLYVKMERDDNITYPVPTTKLSELADMDGPIQVGVYELKEVLDVECVVKTSTHKAKRR